MGIFSSTQSAPSQDSGGAQGLPRHVPSTQSQDSGGAQGLPRHVPSTQSQDSGGASEGEELEKKLNQIRDLVEDLKKFPELDGSVLPTLNRLHHLIDLYGPESHQIAMADTLMESGVLDVLKKLVHSASPEPGEELEKKLKQIRDLVEDLKKFPELDDSVLPTLYRLDVLYDPYSPGSDQIAWGDVFMESGGLDVLMKLVRSASPDGSQVPDEAVRRVEIATRLILNYCESLEQMRYIEQLGGVKYLVNLLRNQACDKSKLRQDTRNIRRFTMTTMANFTMKQELKGILRQEDLVAVSVCYANIPDNPCKVSALEALCRIINVDEPEVTCNNTEAISVLIRTLNKKAYKGYIPLENILYSTQGLTTTLALISAACTTRSKILEASAIPIDEALKNVETEVKETLGIDGPKEEQDPPTPKPYELEFGDIAVSRGQRDVQIWPMAGDGKIYVPYMVSSAFGVKDFASIQEAVNEFTAKTCVRFIPRMDEKDFINIQALGESWSFMGRRGGAQSLSLSEPGAVQKGTVLHEFMHALGFHHEHCRPDRDQHIQVWEDNIQEEHRHNFRKLKSEEEIFGLPYDYDSIMHYSITAFAKNEKRPVIVPLVPKVIGHGNSLSNLDVVRIHSLYKAGGEDRMRSVWTSFLDHLRVPEPAQDFWVTPAARKVSKEAKKIEGTKK